MVLVLQCTGIRCEHKFAIEPLRQNLETVSLCKILQFSLLNFD